MEEHVVLYRQFRPLTFDDVIGQKASVGALRQAVISGRLAHAYLFCGQHGTGKTTIAKIFSRAVNCEHPVNGNPCNECPTCKGILDGSILDVVEMDAASNNGVDDIRPILREVNFTPTRTKYKVYIIDEVHMLSGSAFNAFLKTLEEPPAYAKFILATTEKHKILPTILSRCQVYDFKRINDNDIVRHLQYVAQQEGVSAEEDALRVVATKADGALRDALSIFDQLVSFSGKNITYKDTIQNLNVLDVDNYFQVMDMVLSEDVSGALLLLDDILAKGFDAQNFISGLATHIRNLLLAQNPGTVQLLQMSDAIKQKLQVQAQKADRMLLTRALELANQCDFNYKMSNNKRLSVELCMMQINANYVYMRHRARQSQER